MPPNFMVRSQVPTYFLRSSCLGPGLGKSWAGAAGAASAATTAAAQNQRTVFIGTLHEVTGTGCRGAAPPTASRRVRSDSGRGLRQPMEGNTARVGVVGFYP